MLTQDELHQLCVEVRNAIAAPHYGQDRLLALESHLAGREESDLLIETLSLLVIAFRRSIKSDQPSFAQIESLITTVLKEKKAEGGTVNIDKFVVRDFYNSNGQTGAMGPNASAENLKFEQVWNECASKVELALLAESLAEFRLAMRARSPSLADDIMVGKLAVAEAEAREGNGAAVCRAIFECGQDGAQIARDLGIEIVATAFDGICAKRN